MSGRKFDRLCGAVGIVLCAACAIWVVACNVAVLPVRAESPPATVAAGLARHTANANRYAALRRAAATAGEPFPVVAWFQPVAMLDRVRDVLGANTVFGPEVENPKGKTAAQLAAARGQWLAETAARGLRVVVKPWPELTSLPPHVVGILTDVDEPNAKGTPPAVVAAEAKLWRIKYPGVPIYCSLAGDKVSSANFARDTEKKLYADYAAAVDVLTVNAYSRNRNADRYPDSWVAQIVEKLRPFGKPVLPWIEVNDQRLGLPTSDTDGDGVKDTNRAPTPAEIKAQWDACRAAGAAGIGAFTTQDAGKYGWPQSYFPDVDRNGKPMAAQYAAFKALAESANPPPPPPDDAAAIRAELAKAIAERDAAQVKAAQADERSADAQAKLAASEAAYAIERNAKLGLIGELRGILDRVQPIPPPPSTRPATRPVGWVPKAVYDLNAAIWPEPNAASPTPGVRPFNWGTYAFIAPYQSNYVANEEQVRAFARLCRDGGALTVAGRRYVFHAGAPTALDWEGYANGPDAPGDRARPDLDWAAVAAIAQRHARWFKAEAPGVAICLHGIPYYTDFDPDGITWRAAHAADDFAMSGLYAYSEAAYDAQQRDYVARDVGRLRAIYPGKPILYSVCPKYPWGAGPWDDLAPPAFVARYLAFAKSQGDALACWSPDGKIESSARVFGVDALVGVAR